MHWLSFTALLAGLSALTLLGACSDNTTGQDANQNDAGEQDEAKSSAEADRAGPDWAHKTSDIPEDEDIIFGQLENGMHYAVMANETPSGGASLRMRFDVGALAEEDDQDSLTHFLEHMVFNGSENVPEGELVKILEREGLSFGADTNARTALDETVYMLDIPDVEALDTALFLFREAADRLLLDPEAIDRERGVLMQEKRLRDTPARRRAEAFFDFLYPETRIGDRISDDPEVIQNAAREDFLDLYEGYYRPERTMLVAVGDFDAQEIEQRIKDEFASFAQPGEGKPDPDIGPIVEFDDVRASIFVDEGTPTFIQLNAVSRDDPSDDLETYEVARQEAERSLANAIVNRRFQTLANQPDSVIAQGFAYGGEQFDIIDASAIGVVVEPADWEAGLKIAEQELRRALEHGFTQAELDEQIANARAELENRAEGADTRESAQIAEYVVSSYAAQDVVTDPQTELETFNRFAEQITLNDVEGAFRQQWEGVAPQIFVSISEEIEGGTEAVLAAYEESRSEPVEPPQAKADFAFAYEDFGEPGAVAERTEIEDLDVTQVRFANNVRLNVKQTDFQKDVIHVRVAIDGGALSQPSEPASLHLLASSAFLQGGLGEHSADEIQGFLAGKQVSRSFGVSPDTFVFSAQTRPKDFTTALQLLGAYVTDAGYREEASAQYQRNTNIQYGTFSSTPIGVLQRDFTRMLFGGDPRFGQPEDVEAALEPDLDALRAWLEPHLQNSAMEITVVGDVETDTAIDAVASVFGALDERAGEQEVFDPSVIVTPEGESFTRRHEGPPDAGLAAGIWPMPVSRDQSAAEAGQLLADVMSLKLTEQVREAEGASYAAQSGLALIRDLPNFGGLYAFTDPAPERIDEVLGMYKSIAAQMREGEISEDEMTRARNPRLENLRQSREENPYWLNLLSESQMEPEVLDRHRTQIEAVESVTIEDIQALAEDYLTEDAMTAFTVRPAEAS